MSVKVEKYISSWGEELVRIIETGDGMHSEYKVEVNFMLTEARALRDELNRLLGDVPEDMGPYYSSEHGDES